MSAASTEAPLGPIGIALRTLLPYVRSNRGRAPLSSCRVEVASDETGISVSATVHPQLQRGGVASEPLQEWLLGVLAASPSLQFYFNGRLLRARAK
jgi:hypothetical protein